MLPNVSGVWRTRDASLKYSGTMAAPERQHSQDFSTSLSYEGWGWEWGLYTVYILRRDHLVTLELLHTLCCKQLFTVLGYESQLTFCSAQIGLVMFYGSSWHKDMMIATDQSLCVVVWHQLCSVQAHWSACDVQLLVQTSTHLLLENSKPLTYINTRVQTAASNIKLDWHIYNNQPRVQHVTCLATELFTHYGSCKTVCTNLMYWCKY